MALLTPHVPSETGTLVSSVAASGGGDTFAPGDHVFLHVSNLGGSPITVTFDSVVPSNFGTDEDTGGTVAAVTTRAFGPFPASRYASATTGLVSVTYSGVTSVLVAIYAA